MKLKKLVCILFAITLLIGTTNVAVMAKAATLDDADLCLIDTIDLMLDENIENLSYSRQELFNYELEPVGYSYTVHINGKNGFALMIKRSNYYEITEFYPNKILPYNNIDGIAVYLTPLCYIEYLEGQYRDIENDFILDDEQLLNLKERGFGYKEDGYEGTGESGEIIKETVNFETKTVDEGKIQGGVPTYFNLNSALTGTCAVQAGAVVAGYYARYYPELIPGYMVGMSLGGDNYMYLGQGSTGQVQLVINDLYVKMETNVGGSGTTATGFRNGLASYVQSKGKNITYTSIATNNTLNYELFKTQITNRKPSVLFLNTYNVIAPPAVDKIDNNNDGIERKVYYGMHVMIGYGYKKYMYYKNGTNFRTDYYIEAYTGIADCAQGFIKLYDYSILVEGYAINIY